jgi:hypothetical protein
MSLTVNVAVTGSIDANHVLTAAATYSQGASNPLSPGVVDSGGDINLNLMNDQNNTYSNETGITFMMSGTITDTQGNHYAANFPSGNPVTITGGSGNNQFTPSLVSDTQLFIGDADSNGQTYHYCLACEPDMLSADTPTCGLDPNIVNR